MPLSEGIFQEGFLSVADKYGIIERDLIIIAPYSNTILSLLGIQN